MAIDPIDDELRRVALEVKSLDGATADRLLALAQAVGTGADARQWDGVDVLGAIDPAGLADRLRRQPLLDVRLAGIERWRNVLALCPVLFTWIGLMVSAFGYETATTADPALLGRPFLLLWEEGFDGHVGAPWAFFTLGHIAIIDVGVIGTMLALSWLLHREINVLQARREQRAQQLYDKVHQVAWRAALIVAERTSTGGMIDQMRQTSQGLLDELRAERQRIAELVDERERTTDDLRITATAFKAGAGQVLQLADQVCASLGQLKQVAVSLDNRTTGLIQQQQTLEAALRATGKELNALGQAHNASAGEIQGAVKLLAEAGTRSVAAQAKQGDHIQQLGATVRDLRDRLAQERAAYETAAQGAKDAAHALQQSFTGAQGAMQPLQQTAKDLQTLGSQLAVLPAQLQQVTKDQITAADRLADAAAQLSSAQQQTSSEFRAALAGIAQATRVLAAHVPALKQVMESNQRANDQVRDLIAQTPTADTFGRAIREGFAEVASAVHTDGATSTNGRTIFGKRFGR